MNVNKPWDSPDLHKIVENITKMILVIDGHGRLLYANKMWITTLGYAKEVMEKLHFHQIFESAWDEERPITLKEIKEGHKRENFCLNLIHEKGHKVLVQGDYFPIIDELGLVSKAVFILKNENGSPKPVTIQDKLLKMIHAKNDFLMGDLEEIDYKEITSLMKFLSDAQYVSFNLYEPTTGELQTMASAGDDALVQRAEKLLGFGIDQKKWGKNQEKKHLLKDQVMVVIDDLLSVTHKVLDESLARKMENEFLIGEVILVNIVKDQVSLGDFTLIMHKEKKFVSHEIVELFACQIGLVIEKDFAEKKLIQNKEKYLQTIEAAGAAIWEWNLITNEVNYSRKWAEMLGYSLDELERTPTQWEQLLHPQDKDIIKKNMEEYLLGKSPSYEIIHRLRTKTNEYKWILARGSLAKDEEKNSLDFIGIHMDVTHIHNEEEKRIIENKKLNNILEATNAGIWEWNVLTGEMIYNQRWAEIIGYTLEEISPITKETFKTYAHPEDYEKSQKEIQEIFDKKKEFYSIECRMKHKDGRTVWVLDQGKVIRWTKEGKPSAMFGTHIDITDSKNLELEVKESEDKYRILVESSYDIVYHIDMRGNFTFVSKAWTEQLGHSMDVVGKPFRPYVHPEDLPMIWNFFGSVEKSKERMQTSDYRLLHKDGTWHWFNTNATALWNEFGENVGFAGTARDVTEMKLATKKLREQKDELEQFFTVNLDFFCILNPLGYFLKLNLPWEKELGYTQDYLLSRPVLDFIHEDDYLATKQAFETMVLEKREAKIITRFRRIDGTYRILEWKAQYNDEVVYAAARDVTNNKLLEESLHLEKELFRTTLLSVGDGVIATNHLGKITIMNDAAQKMTGFTLKEAMGLNLHEVYVLYEEESKASLRNHIQEVVSQGVMKENEDVILVSKDKKEIPIEDRSSPIRDKNGQITGAVIVFRDITDKKEKQKRNEYMIYHDALTGLYNRRYMDEALVRVERSRHLPLTIMVVDVNGLKLTNDAFGHDRGDELLIKVAETLTQVSREGDVVARVGGDEFVLILPKTNIQEAELIKKKINKIAKEKEDHPIMVSLGVGYATKTYETQNLKEVQKVADNNMYRNKLKYGKIMKRNMVNEILKSLNEEFEPEKKHLENVEVYCRDVAKALGFSEAETKKVMKAGRLHDIGKVFVPKAILEKPGKLTLEEYEIIKRHPEVSYQILKSVDEYATIAEDVLYHHERMDGKGYPEGIKGHEIPLNSRIISVVDSYDAMVGNRSYQKRKTKFEAIEELKNCSGTQFDPYIVDVFVNRVLLRNHKNSTDKKEIDSSN